MTNLEIVNSIRKKILELNVGVFENSDIVRFVNDCILEICSDLSLQSRVKKTTLNFTNGEANVPDDYLSFNYATDGNKEFILVNIENFEEDESSDMLTILGGKFLIKPTTTSSISLYYFYRPQNIDIDENQNNSPDIPELLHEVLVYGGVYKCLEDMQENELANIYQQKYNYLLQKRINLLRKNENNGQIGQPIFSNIELL